MEIANIELQAIGCVFQGMIKIHDNISTERKEYR